MKPGDVVEVACYDAVYHVIIDSFTAERLLGKYKLPHDARFGGFVGGFRWDSMKSIRIKK